MVSFRSLASLALAASLSAGTASAQETAARIQMGEPSEVVCRARDVAQQITRPREALCVVGHASHPSGIARVTLNGVPLALRAPATEGVPFVGFVPFRADTLSIIAYPVDGAPVLQQVEMAAVESDGEVGYVLRLGAPARVLEREAAPPAAVAARPADAPAQGSGSLMILEPSEWTGEGTRSLQIPPGESLRIVGRVHHPAGIARVVINGAEVPLQPHPSGWMQFIAQVPGESVRQGVEVAAFPVAGDALRKRFGAEPAAAQLAAAEPGGPAEAQMTPQHYVEILEPTEWAGTSVRSVSAPMRRSVRVVGEARHESGVRTVRINGARASAQPQANGAVRFVGYVPVGTTPQSVNIEVEGSAGRALRRQFTVQPDGSTAAESHGVGGGFKGERWAVVVGISQYADTAITALRYADRDARAFYEFLRSPRAGGSGFKEENIKLLLNEEATALELRRALFTFLKQSTPDDQVIIYFAGHGAPDPERRDDLYLLAHDTQKSDISGTGYPMYEVQNAVQRVLARDILVITDACHSAGVSVGGTRSLEVNQINEIFLNQLNASTGGIVTFTASMANELSNEGEQWGGGHGVFTYHMLEALRGAADEDGDGIITLGEMMEYTRNRVRRETRNSQTPNISTTSYDKLWPMSIVVDPAVLAAYTPPPPPAARAPATESRGTAPAAAGAVDPAVEELRLARERVQLFPNSGAYQAQLARALQAAGDAAEALKAFAEAVRLEPSSAAHRYELGRMLLDDDNAQTAVAALQEAVRLDANNAAYRHALALAFLAAGQSNDAIESFRRAVRMTPAQGLYHRDLGRAYAQAGRSREALTSYEEAIRLEPAVARYPYEYAAVLGSAGRTQDAISALQAAARLDPENAAYQRDLGDLLRRTGSAQLAAAAYREAIRLDATDARLHHELGVLHRALNMAYEELAAFREAVRLDGSNAAYRFDLGLALRGSSRAEDSLDELRQATELEPENARYHNGYGLALQQAGRPAEALDELRAALRLAPAEAAYHYDLALLLRETGSLDEAIAAVEEAQRLNRSDTRYRDELRNLRTLKNEQRRRSGG
jgi:protein O-mannosyl-transferase